MNKSYILLLLILLLTSFISVREGFGDGLLYGWGRYYPDSAKYFNQPLILKDQDGSRAGYSNSLGGNCNAYNMMELSDLENRIAHYPISATKRKSMVCKDVSGKIKDRCVKQCDYDIQKYGNVFEQLIKPQPLYTTTLLASELNLR